MISGVQVDSRIAMRRADKKAIAERRRLMPRRNADNSVLVAGKPITAAFGGTDKNARRRSVGCERLAAGIDRDLTGDIDRHNRRKHEQTWLKARSGAALVDNSCVIRIHEDIRAD